MERSIRRGSLFLAGLMALLTLSGCGPSAAELQARAEARRKAQEAARIAAEAAEAAAKAARQAKLDRIAAIEKSADSLAKSGKREEALAKYVAALQEVDKNSVEDKALREKIIRYALTWPQEPEVPEEARRRFARGMAKLKLAQGGGFSDLVPEFEQAVLAAPWWAAAYYNLGLALESNADYAGAMRNLRFYQLAAPQAQDLKTVEAKIYELEVAQEEAEKTKALSGSWPTTAGGTVYVKMEGGNVFTASTWRYSFRGTKKSGAIEGTVTIAAGHRDYCDIPGETVPFTGQISGDYRRIQLDFTESVYTTSKRWVGVLEGNYACTGVSVLRKSDVSITMVRQ